MIDLYRVYRALKQRAARAESGTKASQYAEEAVEAMLTVLDDPTVENCHPLIEAEEMFLSASKASVTYGYRVLEAIKIGSYEINRPYIKRWGVSDEKPHKGSVYIATSKDRPGQIKIGHTTQAIERRFRQYKIRYGYELDLFFSKEVLNPALVEDLLESMLDPHRVTKWAHGDSIEWYETTPQEALNMLKSILPKTFGKDAKGDIAN